MRLGLSHLVSVACLLGSAGCGRGDHPDVKVSFGADGAAAASAEPLGPGDVRVSSTDGSIMLALVGDSVRLQLSDSLRDKVRQDVASSGDSSGFGGMIARSVSGIVSSAMGFVVRIPVQDLENVRYENGQIRFETRGKHGQVDMSSRGGGVGRSKAMFSPIDGERFVTAVRARQAALNTAR